MTLSVSPLANCCHHRILCSNMGSRFVIVRVGLVGHAARASTALRYNIVDKPDGRLKDHAQPTPVSGRDRRLYFFPAHSFHAFFDFNEKVLGIILAGSVLVIIGLFDDMRAVTQRSNF